MQKIKKNNNMIIKNTSIGWYILEIRKGYLVQKNYYGYTKKEAIRLFNKEYKK